MRYYLAHGTKERYFVHEMLEEALSDEGIEVVNPFASDDKRKKVFLEGSEDDDILEVMEKETEGITGEEIVEDELDLLEGCDGLIAYMSYESIGTAMEIVLNSKHFNRGKTKTFVYLDEAEDEEYLLKHPWLNTFATVCTSFEELVEKVKQNEP